MLVMNHEYYKDPTADKAIHRASNEEMRVSLVITICKAAAKLGGFKIANWIELVDVRKRK